MESAFHKKVHLQWDKKVMRDVPDRFPPWAQYCRWSFVNTADLYIPPRRPKWCYYMALMNFAKIQST